MRLAIAIASWGLLQLKLPFSKTFYDLLFLLDINMLFIV
jgi:hypothetical protein